MFSSKSKYLIGFLAIINNAVISDGALARLTDGTSQYDGTVLVFGYSSRWNVWAWMHQCADVWYPGNSIVLCRMLGYRYHTDYGRTTFWEGARSASAVDHGIDGLHCTGNENNIDECSKFGWSVQSCSSNTYMALKCTDIPSVSTDQVDGYTETGSDITLNCTIMASPNVTNVYWQFTNGQGLTTNLTADFTKYTGSNIVTPSLTIHNTLTTDKGSYFCTATNAEGTGQSLPVILHVLGDLPIAKVYWSTSDMTSETGDDVIIPCRISGDPEVTDVFWEFTINEGFTTKLTYTSSVNGRKYVGSSITTPSLTITNVDVTDSGTYVCVAVNRVGIGQSSPVTLTVKAENEEESRKWKKIAIGFIVSFACLCLIYFVSLFTCCRWRRQNMRSPKKVQSLNTKKLESNYIDNKDGHHECLTNCTNVVPTVVGDTKIFMTRTLPPVEISAF